MAISSKANNSFASRQEKTLKNALLKAQAYVRAEGFTISQDDDMGARIYTKPEGGREQVHIFLGEPNYCPKGMIGSMFFVSAEGEPDLDNVLSYVHRKDVAATKNPALRFLKKHFG